MILFRFNLWFRNPIRPRSVKTLINIPIIISNPLVFSLEFSELLPVWFAVCGVNNIGDDLPTLCDFDVCDE